MEKILQEENQAFLVGYLGCYVRDLLCVFDTFFSISVSPIMISAFKTSTFFKNKNH